MGCKGSKSHVMRSEKIFVGADYDCVGVVDDDAKAEYEGMMAGQSQVQPGMMTDEFIQTGIRANFEGTTAMYAMPIFKPYLTEAGYDVKEVQLGGPKYGQADAVAQKAFIQKC